MLNLSTCLIFNIIGLGSYYFISLLCPNKEASTHPGTAIFWGFTFGTLLTYIVWLIYPSRLDIAVYITFMLSMIGVGFLFKKENIKTFICSSYFITLLCMVPFIFVVEYTPLSWDEFSHWVKAPKGYYFERTLTPHTSGMIAYTPLWPLQEVYFQFFTFGKFSSSIIYVFRINLFLSFIFFIKEIKRFSFLLTLFLLLGILYLLNNVASNVTRFLTIEFPVYMMLSSVLFLIGSLKGNKKDDTNSNLFFLFLALIAAYMLKKPCIAVIPAAVFVLLWKGYKKQTFYFLSIFFFFYISWSLKTMGVAGNLPCQAGQSLWSPKALSIYQALGEQFFVMKYYFIFFVLCMIFLYRNNREVFVFSLIFSILYYCGLVWSYIFVFSDFEGPRLAAYERYLSVIFIPIFIFSCALFISKMKRFMDIEEGILKTFPQIEYITSILLAFFVVGFFYYNNLDKKHYILEAFDKIRPVYDVKDKSVMAIWQGSTGSQFLATDYALYGETSSVAGGSFGPVADNLWRTVKDKKVFAKELKAYDIILVVGSDAWLNDILFEITGKKTDGLRGFALLKKENGYELLPYIMTL